jgi:integrase
LTGLRFLLRVTMRRLDLTAEIYHIREPQKIPLVIRPDETRRLLAVADNLKVRTLLSLGYGCGLRAGEVVRLKVKHIDSAQKIIRVEQSKGRKDRCHAVAGDVRPAAPMVEGAPIASRCHNAASGTMAVSRPQARQADDHPAVKPSVP